MQKLGVSARLIELERESLVSIENTRTKFLVRAYDVVRDVVPIRPGNGRPSVYGEVIEAEPTVLASQAINVTVRTA